MPITGILWWEFLTRRHFIFAAAQPGLRWSAALFRRRLFACQSASTASLPKFSQRAASASRKIFALPGSLTTFLIYHFRAAHISHIFIIFSPMPLAYCLPSASLFQMVSHLPWRLGFSLFYCSLLCYLCLPVTATVLPACWFADTALVLPVRPLTLQSAGVAGLTRLTLFHLSRRLCRRIPLLAKFPEGRARSSLCTYGMNRQGDIFGPYFENFSRRGNFDED